MRATHRRLQGTEQFLGFYDVHANRLSGLFQKRERLPELGGAFRRLRRLRIRPVWTPTEASWLNLIEARFGVLKRFTLANSDDPAHGVRRRRIYRYLRYRHRKLGTVHHPLNRIPSIRRFQLEWH